MYLVVLQQLNKIQKTSTWHSKDMKYPPNLPEATIEDSLLRQYGIIAQQLRFIPEGADSWIYVCQSKGHGKVVLKIKKRRRLKRTIAYKQLMKQGFVYMPKLIFNDRGHVWSRVGPYHYYVQEYIDSVYGHDGFKIRDNSLPQLGMALKELHSVKFPWHVRMCLQKETYSSAAHKEISGYAKEAEKPNTDMYQEPKGLYLQNRAKIRELLDFCERNGKELKKQRPRRVIVHDDIHGMNILTTSDNRVFIADWDRCRIAPIENDLMYLDDRQLRVMSKTYGRDLTKNRTALKYYRSHLLLRDMCLFWGEAISNEKADVREHYMALFKKSINRIDAILAQ